MAMTVTKLTVSTMFAAQWRETIRGRTRRGTIGTTNQHDFTHGTGANQVNCLYDDVDGTIPGGGTDSIDLSGSLVDDAGTTVAATAIKVFRLKNTGTVNIRYGGGINAWVGPIGATATLTLEPGDEALFVRRSATGWPVTGGTADILTIANLDGATAAAYELHLAGEV